MLKFKMLKVFAAAVLVSSLAACGGDYRESTTTTQAALGQALGGEEVFRGLVFGEGAVAAQLPEVWRQLPPRELTLEQREAQERLKAELMADIREADPTFFDRFGADIQSGDHLRIERTMEESAGLMKQAVAKRVPEASPRSGAEGTCVIVWLAANAVAVINLAAVANVAVTSNWAYVDNYLWETEPFSKPPETQLGRDQVIDMIATRLVAA